MRIDEWKVKFMERSKKIGILLNFVGSLGSMCEELIENEIRGRR